MIDWQKRAEDALGITSGRESLSKGYGGTGTQESIVRAQFWVPRVAAALAQAYGEGLGAGRNENT